MEEDSFLSAGRMRKMHLVKMCLIRISLDVRPLSAPLQNRVGLVPSIPGVFVYAFSPHRVYGPPLCISSTDELQAVLTHVTLIAGLS